MVACLGFMAYQPLYVTWSQINFYANSQFFFKLFSFELVHCLPKTFLFQAIQGIQTLLIQLIQFSISKDFVQT